MPLSFSLFRPPLRALCPLVPLPAVVPRPELLPRPILNFLVLDPGAALISVSYTHLTLPTLYSV